MEKADLPFKDGAGGDIDDLAVALPRIIGSTALAHSNGPRVLTRITLSHSSELISWNGLRRSLPKRAALSTSTWTCRTC